MKRLNSQVLVVPFIFVALVVALIIALPASRPLMADPPGQKVCHVLPGGPMPGVVILAPSDQALAQHLAHGDFLSLAPLGDRCADCFPPNCEN